jgi:uncharacterized protein
VASWRRSIIIGTAITTVALIVYVLRLPSQGGTDVQAPMPIIPQKDGFGVQIWEASPDALEAQKVAKIQYESQDYSAELREYSGLAQQGKLFAVEALAGMYQSGVGADQDYQKAFSLFKECAEDSYAPCENDLSFMYANGLGTEKNPSYAFSWELRSAQQHYLLAYIPLAFFYAQGDGTQIDPIDATTWAHRAVAVLDDYAASGAHDKDGAMASVEAQLGDWYEYQNNYPRASQIYQKAIDLGHEPHAQEKLGLLYWSGQGVQLLQQKAVDLWIGSAEQLNGDAFLDLAKAYQNGWYGTSPDSRQYCAWHELAVAIGAEPASVIESWSMPQREWDACLSSARDFLSRHPGAFRTETIIPGLRTGLVVGRVAPTDDF